MFGLRHKSALILCLPAVMAFAQSDNVISQARETAFSFTQSLPDYMVKQITTRFATDAARNSRTAWKQNDVVTADVTYEYGRETYANLLENGKRVKDAQQTGTGVWTEGEFAGILRTIFATDTAAAFSGRQQTVTAGRPSWRYAYSVEQPHSAWRVRANGETLRPKYSGLIWIDRETSRVLRIEMQARDLPLEFPLDSVTASVDYDFVPIGDGRYLVPIHSETASCLRGTTQCTRNVIEFRNYRKYGASTSIQFEGAASQ